MNVARDIANTVDLHAKLFGELSAEQFSRKPAPGKWSPQEVLGHLIDSAQNNIQRFIRGQYEIQPKIVYAQEEWVRFTDYHDYPKADLIQLWVLINRHLCRILVKMDPANYNNECNTGKNAVELHTLSWLADDYHVHMVHHLNQIKERI